MSYANEDQLAVYAPNDTFTPEVAGRLLSAATNTLDEQLTFSFGGDLVTHVADGGASTRILLPPPGAAAIITVVEGGITLASALYEVDPRKRRRLLRLDVDGLPVLWASGRRNITVTYAPTPAPEALVEACLEVAVIIWRGAPAGFADTVGVQGSTEMTYRRALPDSARLLLRSLRDQYGVVRRGR